jgi:hypothetical protein
MSNGLQRIQGHVQCKRGFECHHGLSAITLASLHSTHLNPGGTGPDVNPRLRAKRISELAGPVIASLTTANWPTRRGGTPPSL